MKKIMTFLFVMCVLLFTPITFAGFIELQEGSETSLSSLEILESKGSMDLLVYDKNLKDVLQAIQNKSGLKVSLDDQLLDIPVDADIQEDSWVEVLKMLLHDFNVMFNFIDSDITGVMVLSLRDGLLEQDQSVMENDGNTTQESGVVSDRGGADDNTTEISKTNADQSLNSIEDDRPILVEGEYIGDTRIKIRRSYPEGFRVSVIPATTPPGLTDHTPPPGAEGTMFRPPIPTPGKDRPKNIDNTPPPGSTE